MIYLITGQPGHGKTLRALELACNFVAAGREVYAHGVRGLNYNAAGFKELEDPKNWQDLPDGSVILLDECYTVFPTRSGASKVPPHVEAMATHRHRGFDFIIIAQQAQKQIDGFLLGLIERHEHVRRKFGFKKAVILWWDKFSPNVNNSDTRKFWAYPEKIMKRNLYESTVVDTTQFKIPWFYYALPVAIGMVVFFAWRVQAFFHQEPEPVKGQGTSLPLSSSTLPAQQDKRPDDIAAYLAPRLEGQPWTARAYDHLPIATSPEIYCIAVEDLRCSCLTEQGTKYVVSPKICRTIARDGVYNPTRRVERQESVMSRPDRQQVEQGTAQPYSVATGNGWHSGIGSQSYTPPGTPGSWNSDPFGKKQ